MSVPEEQVEELIEKFRQFSPRDLASLEFHAGDTFFSYFDDFKLPLIAYLSDKVEEAMRNVPDNITHDFLKGYVDGTISILRLIADLQLVKNGSASNGA